MAQSDRSAAPSFLRRISTFFYRHPRLSLLILLAPPLLWLGVVYLGSLFALAAQSFYHLEPFSGKILRDFSFSNYQQLLDPSSRDIIGRTTLMAALVTLFSIPLAFPISYYIARYAKPRMKTVLFMAVLVPLWSSYLVRVYAWKLI